MFIYELYKSFIKNGDDEFFDYFEFVFFWINFITNRDIVKST